MSKRRAASVSPSTPPTEELSCDHSHWHTSRLARTPDRNDRRSSGRRIRCRRLAHLRAPAGRPLSRASRSSGNPAAARALRDRAAARGIRLSNISAYQFYPDVGWDDVAPAIDATADARCADHRCEWLRSRYWHASPRCWLGYCEAAAASGIRVALEFLPYSGVRTLDDALRIVEATGADERGRAARCAAPRPVGRRARRHRAHSGEADGVRTALRREALDGTANRRSAAKRGADRAAARRHRRPAALRVPRRAAGGDGDRVRGRARRHGTSVALEKARAAHDDAERFMRAYAEHRA